MAHLRNLGVGWFVPPILAAWSPTSRAWGATRNFGLETATRNVPALTMLRLAGVEPAKQRPFGASAEMFDMLVAASPEGARFSRLLRDDTSVSGQLGPLRVFEATRIALFALVPTLMVFDDLQWADDMSVSLCQYLLRSALQDGCSVGLVFASRTGRTLAAVRRALQTGDPSLVEISLRTMGCAAGVALARSIHPASSVEEADQLYVSAAASPFWIEALARRAGGIETRDLGITSRLLALSSEEADCLAAITVIARPMTRSELGRALVWPLPRVQRACARLVDSGLVSAAGSGFRVAHDLIREAAYQQIPGLERAQLHRRVAELLERDSDGDLRQLAQAMGHRVAVGSPPLSLAVRIARSPHRRPGGQPAAAQRTVAGQVGQPWRRWASAVTSANEARTTSVQVRAFVRAHQPPTIGRSLPSVPW